MDKTIHRKSYRINGDKRCRINTPIGILASDGTELLVGDYIFYRNEKCIVLFNIITQKYEAMLCRSCWYNDKIHLMQTLMENHMLCQLIMEQRCI